MTCKHCNINPVPPKLTKQRLCHRCYAKHRTLYYQPPAQDRMPTQLGSPTTALPGSPEKIAALASRYGAGLQLWNPEDFLPPPLARQEACRYHGPKVVSTSFSLEELDHEP